MSDFTWNGGTGSFNQASKWTDVTNPALSGSTYPQASDTADFATNGSVSGSGTVTTLMVELAIIASFTASIKAVSIVDNGTVTVASGGLFTTTGETHVNGLLRLQGGGDLAAAAGNSLLANIEVDAGGTLSATGSGSTITTTVGGVVVGATGTGTLALSSAAGATLSSSVGSSASMIIGQSAAANGLVTVTGATLTTTSGGIAIGYSGRGTLALSGGATANIQSGDANSSSLIIGRYAGANGLLTLTGAARLTTTGGANIGDGGQGTLTINGGSSFAATSNNPMVGAAIGIGGPHAGMGTVSVSGSGSQLVANAGGMSVGSNGTGDLTVQAGALLLINDNNLGLDIGSDTGGQGTVTLTGTNTSLDDMAGLQVGDNGAGTLVVVADATATIDYDLQIALQDESTGTATIDGAAVLVDGAVVVGELGDGTLAVQAGAILESAAGFVSTDDGGSGTVTVSDASWGIDDLLDISLTAESQGTVIITGGTAVLEVGGEITVGDDGTGTLDIEEGGFVSGGTLVVAAQSDSGTLTPSDVTIAGNGSTLYISGNATIDEATATNTGYGGTWTYGDSGVGTIWVEDGGYLAIGQTLTLLSPNDPDSPPILTIGTDGAAEIGGDSGPTVNELQVDAAGLIIGHGTIAADPTGPDFKGATSFTDYSLTVANNGNIEASQGTLVIDASIDGFGMFTIDTEATLELAGTVGTGATVMFPDSGPGTLALDDPSQFAGTIDNFVQGDVLDLLNTPPVSADQSLSVTYQNGTLAVGTLDTFTIAGTDPVPTFDFLPDGHGGTEIQTTPLTTLLSLSFDTYNTNSAGTLDYTVFNGDTLSDAGFKAVAYQYPSPDGGDPSIVIAFRGTSRASKVAFLKNIIADASFVTGSANAMLKRYVKDAANFVESVYNQALSKFPDTEPVITVAGHSLGGAIAQIVGASANFASTAFDAPGSGDVYSQLTAQLGAAAGLGSGGTSLNFRLQGDQVSEAGSAFGQIYTINSPFPSDTVAQTIANFINNHAVGTITSAQYPTGFLYAYQYDNNIANYAVGRTGTDLAGPIATALLVTAGAPVTVGFAVAAKIASILDPPGGTSFTLTGNAGSPFIASVTLPFLAGVANYDVAYEIGSSFSAFQTIAPGVEDDFPANVDGITIDPVDSLGNAATLDPGFLFTATFASSGTFTGTLATSGGGAPEGLPVTTPASLTVAPHAGATPLGIAAPTDAAYPDPTTLAVEAETLPSNGTVTLSDGVSAVHVGDVLTVAQLTSLEFTPTAADAGSTSSFTYSVTDEDFATTDGVAGISIACYRRGTRIMTDRGEVAIENLAIGDLVINRLSEARPIRWIGWRRYAGRFAAANPAIRPVRISAGALARNVPRRDLYISPAHALYFKNMLIPALALVNGGSIVQLSSVEEVEYFHLELDTHDVILAEGARSESYLDLENRGMFHNAGEYDALYPTPARPPAGEYAPRRDRGGRVNALRARLAARAVRLGHVLPCTHSILLASTGITRARIAAGVSELHLMSTSAYAVGDRRRLGALVRSVHLDGVRIDLRDRAFHRGFHAVERHGDQLVRWTDGEALIAVPAGAMERLVEVDIAACAPVRMAS